MDSEPPFKPGDVVWFQHHGEPTMGTISEIFIYQGETKAEVLVPGEGAVRGVKESHLWKRNRCRTHSVRKLYSKERGDFFCPFCEGG